MHFQIRPKSSVSPKALMSIFGVLAGLSVTIGLVFWAIGATLVLPFAVMETLLLGFTFLYHARSLANYDDVLLEDSFLIVRKERFGQMVEHRFNRGFCRISLSRERHPVIRIEESGRFVEFGQWDRPTEVSAIFTELQAKISQQRAY
jgi:uncharacterized membrane protein